MSERSEWKPSSRSQCINNKYFESMNLLSKHGGFTLLCSHQKQRPCQYSKSNVLSGSLNKKKLINIITPSDWDEMTFTFILFWYSQCHVCHQHAPTCQRSMSAMIAFQMTHNYVFRHIQTSAATNKLSSCYPVITKRMTHNFFLPQKLWSLNNVWHISKKLHSTNKLLHFYLLKGFYWHVYLNCRRPFKLQFYTLSSISC